MTKTKYIKHDRYCEGINNYRKRFKMTRLSDLKEGDEAYVKVQFYQDIKDGTDFPIRIKFSEREDNRKAWMPDLPVKRVEEIEDVKPKIKVPKKIGEIIDNNTLKDLVDAFDCDTKEVWRWFYDNYENDVNDVKDVKDAEKGVMVLAEIKINGYEIQEPLGVLLVDMPAPQFCDYYFLSTISAGYKVEDYYSISVTSSVKILKDRAFKVTKAEAKEKYPNFKWVPLEELESEK